MKHPVGKALYWTPRILSLVFVCFLALFSLDVFDMGLGFWGTAAALLIHNLPSLILLLVVIVAWKHEIVGAVGFILGGFLYIGLLMRNPFEWYYMVWALQISGTAFLIGALFLVGWRRKRG